MAGQHSLTQWTDHRNLDRDSSFIFSSSMCCHRHCCRRHRNHGTMGLRRSFCKEQLYLCEVETHQDWQQQQQQSGQHQPGSGENDHLLISFPPFVLFPLFVLQKERGPVSPSSFVLRFSPPPEPQRRHSGWAWSVRRQQPTR